MAQFRVFYSLASDKYIVKRNTAVGWVPIDEFNDKDAAVDCANRLRGRRA